MARKTHSELTAGIFVVTVLAVAFGVVVWLGGSGVFQTVSQRAYFYAEEKSGSIGIQQGSPVQIGDDQIGKVSRIYFDPENHRTYYEVDIGRKGVPIYSDGQARVTAALIGGAKLVIINRGKQGQPLADREHPIELRGGMDQTMSNLATVSERLNKIATLVENELEADRAGSLLSDLHGIMNSLKDAAANVAQMTKNLKPETQVDNENSLLAKIHVAINNLVEMITDSKPKVSDTLSAVRDTAVKIRTYTDQDLSDLLVQVREITTNILKVSKDMETVSGETRRLVMLNADNIDEMIDNMTLVTANLKATSTEVRRNPWRLLYKPTDKEIRSQNIYDAARSFSTGASQLDQALSKMSGLQKAYPKGLPIDDPEMQKVRDQLKKAFDQFSKAEQALWKELNVAAE